MSRGNLKMIHGFKTAHHPLLGRWACAKQRCYNPNDKNYTSNGLRGITMCDEWKGNFAMFARWIIDNLGWPEEDHSLERVDSNGDYEPGNMQWVVR